MPRTLLPLTISIILAAAIALVPLSIAYGEGSPIPGSIESQGTIVASEHTTLEPEGDAGDGIDNGSTSDGESDIKGAGDDVSSEEDGEGEGKGEVESQAEDIAGETSDSVPQPSDPGSASPGGITNDPPSGNVPSDDGADSGSNDTDDAANTDALGGMAGDNPSPGGDVADEPGDSDASILESDVTGADGVEASDASDVAVDEDASAEGASDNPSTGGPASPEDGSGPLEDDPTSPEDDPSLLLGLEVVDASLLTDPVANLSIGAMGNSAQQAELRQAIDAALQWVPSSLSPAQKVHVVFDYLAATCSYDWTFDWPTAYNAYGALVRHSTACQGYSQAFKLIMDRLGIPCYVVYGVAWNGRRNVGHAWNMVQVEGAWYHVDVTWADLFGKQVPAQSGLDKLYSCDGSHGYLLVSDSVISRDRYWLSSDMPHSCPKSYSFKKSTEVKATVTDIVPPFSDTPPTAWYTTDGYVQYAKDNGLMTGYRGTTRFGPEDPLTRGQVAVILFRYANPDSKATTNPKSYGKVSHFTDVKAGKYYTAAIEWCYQEGIVTGYSGTKRFGPEDPITREQLATMLWRFAKTTGIDMEKGSIKSFPDRGSIAKYAQDAMGWCQATGILTGDGVTGKAMPKANATRAQMAKMITVLTRDVL